MFLPTDGAYYCTFLTKGHTGDIPLEVTLQTEVFVITTADSLLMLPYNIINFLL